LRHTAADRPNTTRCSGSSSLISARVPCPACPRAPIQAEP
jgi:hypothetical protein